ncbi:F-box domain containing protein [Tanacetum coccineum]
MNVQGDRLNNFPNDLIHKILSLVGTKLAVQTSALSSRWSSQSLEHLTLTGFPNLSSVILTLTQELTSLTTLHLESITFNDEVTAKDTGLHLISVHELVSLRFYGWQSEWLKFSAYEFCSLENVDLCILLLSPLMELISYQPYPFVNLKSLKVYPEVYYVKVLQTIPAEVKKYLLDGSPSATFTEVSYEEMRASENAKSALSCMAELGEMLEHEKANIETNMDRIEHGKAKTSAIISMLCDIEELVTELPASKRAQFEASFSRLCTEADSVMNVIMNSIKI